MRHPTTDAAKVSDFDESTVVKASEIQSRISALQESDPHSPTTTQPSAGGGLLSWLWPFGGSTQHEQQPSIHASSTQLSQSAMSLPQPTNFSASQLRPDTGLGRPEVQEKLELKRADPDNTPAVEMVDVATQESPVLLGASAGTDDAAYKGIYNLLLLLFDFISNIIIIDMLLWSKYYYYCCLSFHCYIILFKILLQLLFVISLLCYYDQNIIIIVCHFIAILFCSKYYYYCCLSFHR